MGSFVLDLQKDMLDSNKKVSDLLRKSYIIAKKLKIKDFETWIHNELNGYKHGSKLPPYRKLTCEIISLDPFNVVLQRELTRQPTNQSIPVLESMLGIKESKQDIRVSLNDFDESFGRIIKYELVINFVQISNIFETVKNTILEWSLKLEEDGIVGEDMGFSEDEKEKTEKNNYTVNNFYGEISGQIQQNTANSTQNQTIERMNSDKINEIIDILRENRLETNEIDKKRLDEAIKIVSNEIKQVNPRVNVVKETFNTIKNVLEGIAGSLIASGILYKMAQISF